MDLRQQAPRRFQFTLHKGCVENHLGPVIRDLSLPPAFDLALHRLEITLNPIYTHGQGVNQVEALL